MKRLVSLLLVIVMIVCMSACSSAPKEEAPLEPAVVENEATNDDATNDDATDDSNAGTTDSNSSAIMESFVAESQSAMGAMNEAMKDVMEITLTSEGETMTYTYKFVADVGDLSTVKQSLEGEMENQRSTMESVVKSLKDSGIANPVVVMKYVNNDGTEITSFEFK